MSMDIVQKFYQESLGDMDLTLMIEHALIAYANEKIEQAAQSVDDESDLRMDELVSIKKRIRSLKEDVK